MTNEVEEAFKNIERTICKLRHDCPVICEIVDENLQTLRTALSNSVPIVRGSELKEAGWYFETNEKEAIYLTADYVRFHRNEYPNDLYVGPLPTGAR